MFSVFLCPKTNRMKTEDEKKMVLAIHEKPKFAQWVLLSIQHLFAMFGATVLVPTLTGISQIGRAHV